MIIRSLKEKTLFINFIYFCLYRILIYNVSHFNIFSNIKNKLNVNNLLTRKNYHRKFLISYLPINVDKLSKVSNQLHGGYIPFNNAKFYFFFFFLFQINILVNNSVSFNNKTSTKTKFFLYRGRGLIWCLSNNLTIILILHFNILSCSYQKDITYKSHCNLKHRIFITCSQ